MAISTRINDPWIEGRYGLGQIFAAQCTRNVTGVSPSTTPTLRCTATPIPRSGTNRSQLKLTIVRKQCELTIAATVRARRGEAWEGGRRSGVAVLHEIPAEPRLLRARGSGSHAGHRFASSIPYTLCESLLAHDRLPGIWGRGDALALGWMCPKEAVRFSSYAQSTQRSRNAGVPARSVLKTWRFMELQIYAANSHATSWQSLAGESFSFKA